MNHFYQFGLIIICSISIRKLFLYFNNTNDPSQSYHQKLLADEQPNDCNVPENETTIYHENIVKSKNSWLYPQDEFGIMEKEIVYDSITYQRKTTDTANSKDKIEIVTITDFIS
jgi:hypothetical protein